MPLVYTRHADRLFSDRFKKKIADVYSFFPELQQTNIACGAIIKRGAIQGIATGWTQPPVVRLQPDSSFYTIAHELTHLVQGNGSGIPHGEITCDIWTVDRMPVEYLDQKPYYLLSRISLDWKAKRKDVKRLCRQAIELRSSMHAYIVWLRHHIKEL